MIARDRELVIRTARWMDAFFDADSGLLGYPSREGSPHNPYQQPGVPIVRESAAYAVALLERDEPGDRERAIGALEQVMANQLDAPGTVVHGTFLRSPREPRPGPSPREWIDYDPNWREFIGCSFIVALEAFESRLPDALVDGLERSLRLACEGAAARAVPADYSNIAIMSAFLLDWVGTRLDVEAWRSTGVRLASEVADDYRAQGAFREHNSPTYYGVDLFGLALWRTLAASPSIRGLGAEIGDALWRDLARFYHAGLRNLCGPYSRAYGMDMTRYVAALGAWMQPVLGDAAPIPALGDGVAHGHDFYELVWAGMFGAEPPDDARPDLLAFRASRRIEQVITASPRRVASAWLDEDVMLGGEDASGRFVHWQHHPATIHWRTPAGEVGWMRVVANAPIDAVAHPGRLDVAARTGLEVLAEGEVSVWLEFSPGCEDALAAATGTGDLALALPGLTLEVAARPDVARERHATHATRIGWRFGPGEAPERLELSLAVRTTA